MLKGRNFTYYPKRQHLKITGLPPKGWDDLTTKTLMEEFEKLMGLDVVIMSHQFDH